MENLLPDIFAYIDFREYLDDYYKARKQFDRDFTHSRICKGLGQEHSKGYFNNVAKGRADVTPTFIDRFISVLELKGDEAMYFRALVNYNQTTSPSEKEFSFDQLVRLNRTPFKLIDKKAYDYYKEWHHSAVRAVLDIIDFKDDYKRLATSLAPNISVKQAKDSISLLKQLGIIGKNENGFWKPADKVLVTEERVKDAIVKQFQMKCLDRAKAVLADESITTARNITLTVSISEKSYERILGRVQQFKTEIRSIVHKDEAVPDRVYTLAINFFPISS